MNPTMYRVERLNWAGERVVETVEIRETFEGNYFAAALASMGCGKAADSPEGAIRQLCNNHGRYIDSELVE